jgi:hypothetical protein
MDDQRIDRESGASLKAPRFSLRRYLAAVTLVACGIGVETWLWSGPNTAFKHRVVHYVATVGLAIIGAGLFAPFKRTILGATVFGLAWPTFILLMKWLESTHWIAV